MAKNDQKMSQNGWRPISRKKAVSMKKSDPKKPKIDKKPFFQCKPPYRRVLGVFRGSPFWTLFSTPKTRVNPYSKDPPKRTKKRGETLFFGCFGGGLLIFAAWFFQNLRIRPLKSENRTIGKLSVGIYPPDEKKPVFFNTFFPYQSLPQISLFFAGFPLFQCKPPLKPKKGVPKTSKKGTFLLKKTEYRFL